jgi:catechol 2,3-dioxygenase-like lactoylglutathione lyase family enzyme
VDPSADPAPTPGRDRAGEPATVGQFGGFEVYPMPVFVTLAVQDVNGVAEWYERALGFGTMFRMPAPAGRSAVEGPLDTPWNTRDLRVTDPDGHRLVFTQRAAAPDSGQAQRWQALFDQAARSGAGPRAG